MVIDISSRRPTEAAVTKAFVDEVESQAKNLRITATMMERWGQLVTDCADRLESAARRERGLQPAA